MCVSSNGESVGHRAASEEARVVEIISVYSPNHFSLLPIVFTGCLDGTDKGRPAFFIFSWPIWHPFISHFVLWGWWLVASGWGLADAPVKNENDLLGSFHLELPVVCGGLPWRQVFDARLRPK